jgi:molecular chaperone GrpE
MHKDKKHKKNVEDEVISEDAGANEMTEDAAEELRTKAAERDEYYGKWLNVHAEYENTKRRLEKEKYDHIRFANEGIIARLFPIMDNFDMAFAVMEKAEDKGAMLEGIKLVQKEFHRVLEDSGVKKIETLGKQFDPNIHEAVMAVETEDVPDGEVVEEVRSGYMFNDRLLRAAQVKVAKNTMDNEK